MTARPKYLNLFRIKMPVGAVASIGHRLSGVCLFLFVPVLTYLLDLSLQGPAEYARVLSLVHAPLMQMLIILAVWALAHHLLAGIRFLLLDLYPAMPHPLARAGAWIVNLGGLIVAVSYVGSLL